MSKLDGSPNSEEWLEREAAAFEENTRWDRIMEGFLIFFCLFGAAYFVWVVVSTVIS